MTQYILNNDLERGNKTYSKGTVVYSYDGYDYGLSYDDSQVSGDPHVSVTLNKNGDAPFFTTPVDYLDPYSPAIAYTVNSLINPPSKTIQ